MKYPPLTTLIPLFSHIFLAFSSALNDHHVWMCAVRHTGQLAFQSQYCVGFFDTHLTFCSPRGGYEQGPYGRPSPPRSGLALFISKSVAYHLYLDPIYAKGSLTKRCESLYREDFQYLGYLSYAGILMGIK